MIYLLKPDQLDHPQKLIERFHIGCGYVAEVQSLDEIEPKEHKRAILITSTMFNLGDSLKDILDTIQRFARVIVLDMVIADCSSSDGKRQIEMLEKLSDRHSKVVKQGQAKAKEQGKRLGRPKANVDEIQRLKREGLKQREVVDSLGIGIATVRKYWNV